MLKRYFENTFLGRYLPETISDRSYCDHNNWYLQHSCGSALY